mmetsp:Transcript_15988/g.15707  ORF Transcript_15988/g.15707 Transcript_15988/m.15707 type:complete len:196 (+) Transcript_15988:246-833(+)
MGISAVFRMSMVLALFHLSLAIILAISKTFDTEAGSVLNDGCWSFHFIAIAVLFIASFWITTDIIIVYAYISRFVSMIFLIFQGICILSLAYKFNEFLVEFYNESGSTTSLILLISFTAGIYLFDFVLLWLLYKWFGGCFFNVFLLVLFIAVAIIFTTLTALRTRENASILTNGIVLSYILYLTWAALASDPDEK